MAAVQGHAHQDRLMTFGTEAVDDIFTEVKERLRQVTKSHANPSTQDMTPSDGESCYIASDSDFRVLVDHFSHSIRRLQETSHMTSFTSSATPSTIDPATTISVSEASFPPVIGNQVHDAPSKQETTATVVSGNSITETTWLVNQEFQPNNFSDLLGSFSDREAVQNASKSPVPNKLANQADDDGHEKALRQTSMVVLTNRDDKDEAASLHSSNQASEPRPSLLTRLRRKTVRFVQPEASPIYGGYLNDDYKPRRESSLFRMRTILDRLGPSRPKQNVAVFAALTGAQPVQPTHDLDQDRPMYLRQSCSEDGRQHRCTQHDSVPTSPG